LLALLFFSCTKDELENSLESRHKSTKNNLKLDEFANKNIVENIVVNWETFSKIEKQGFEIYEIGITETDEVTSSYFRKAYNMSLLRLKKML
jgi:uncharacterized surface protein with fasciclin (FAS1) repeats